MPDVNQQSERTESATPRRLQRAREEGQVSVSREVNALAGLVAMTLVLVMVGGQVAQAFSARLSVFLAYTSEPMLAGAAGFQLAWASLLRGAAPFVMAAMLAGCAAVLMQTGFLIHGGALRLDSHRISPSAGFHRLLSPESLIEAGKSLIKVAVMGFASWSVLRADFPSLLLSPRREVNLLLPETLKPVLHVLLVVLSVQAVVTVLDVAWVRSRHARRLRMSRNDMREEQREMEGDPRIKARVKQITMLRARRRMMAAVPKAAVVITNPTHYAVALAYDRAQNVAPRVVAKGVDSLAARIREVAAANRVPMVANPPLAHALYRVELEREIPHEHYQAVAEIIAYVWRLGRGAPGPIGSR